MLAKRLLRYVRWLALTTGKLAGGAWLASGAAALAACGEAGLRAAPASSPVAGLNSAAVDDSGRPAAVTAERGLVHPGILVDRAQLDFVKAKIAEGAEPWQSALTQARSSRFGSLDYTPHPREVVECGPYSNPDYGCSDEKNDVVAAYTHALLFAYTRRDAHARKAIEIMNAWSSVVKRHTNRNAPLQSAWAAQVLPRAGEIIRYTYSGWPAVEIERFGRMLRDVYLPQVQGGSAANGNWETSMIEATMNIGIFNDDRATFEHAVGMWRERVPAYIYLASDGPAPKPPPRGPRSGAELSKFWHGQVVMMDGLTQETCRDLVHVQLGLSGIINAAETARLQGVDLYSEQAERLERALELHARLLNGGAVPSELCGGTLTAVRPLPMWEIALNQLGNRSGYALPETQRLVQTIRPTGAGHHMVWETLTHAALGVSLP